MTVHQLDRAEARRIAVRAQLLDSPRPADLVAVVDRLTLVQIDPTAALAPSADLVLWSRLGSAYRPEQLQQAVELGQPFTGRTALLSPFDRLVHDRARIQELFDFEYGLEMYKPKAKRRWGYFALPVLHLDRLVGKVDATADRRAGVLVVHAIHQDVPFTPEITAAVRQELDDLASWLGLATT